MPLVAGIPRPCALLDRAALQATLGRSVGSPLPGRETPDEATCSWQAGGTPPLRVELRIVRARGPVEVRATDGAGGSARSVLTGPGARAAGTTGSGDQAVALAAVRTPRLVVAVTVLGPAAADVPRLLLDQAIGKLPG